MWLIANAMLAFGCGLLFAGLTMTNLPIELVRWEGLQQASWTVPLGTRAVLGLAAVSCGFAASMHTLGTALRLLNGGGLLPPMQLPPAYVTPRVPG